MATSASLNLTDTTKQVFYTAQADGSMTLNLYNAAAFQVVINIFVNNDQIAARTLNPGGDAEIIGQALMSGDAVYLQAASGGTVNVNARASVLYPSEIGGGGGGGSSASITIDSALSSSSENPVQNKVITAALADKQNILTAGAGVVLTGDTISAQGLTAATIFKTENITWGAMAKTSTAYHDITVAGAEVGDTVIVNTSILTGPNFRLNGAFVESAGIVRLYVANLSASTVTPATADWQICVIKNSAMAA